jgi:hypothetical protein
MMDFKKFIELTEAETSDATDMEKYIVIAYNGSSISQMEKLKVKADNYNKNKKVAEKIAMAIRSKTKASSGSMIHFGKGKGKMINWWEGSPVPKTDLYSTDGINISLKQKGGSQLMSGFPGETRSTFKAASFFMSENSPEDLEKLVEELNLVMKTVVVPGNINSMVQAVKTKILPNEIKAKSGKKELTIKVGGKQSKKEGDIIYVSKSDYQKALTDYIDWKDSMKKITPVVKSFFEKNTEFKTWFAYEAATGATKFKPDPAAKANWVVEFDPKTGDSIIERLDNNGRPSQYLKTLANKSKIRISPKTASGSKVNKDGFGTSTTSLRLTLQDSHTYGNKPMIYEHIEKRIQEFVTKSSELNESSILKSVSDWAKNISEWVKKLLEELFSIIKKLAKKGIQYLLEFIGFEIENVDVEGDLRLFFTT